MKLIVDSDIIISAYTSDGDERIFWQDKAENHTLFICPEIFSEVERQLRWGEFGLEPEKVKDILLDILKHCQFVRISSNKKELPEAKEKKLILLAAQVNADGILSKNTDRFSSGNMEKISFLSLSDLNR